MVPQEIGARRRAGGTAPLSRLGLISVVWRA